jgi:asparagine synthase (glutamine-hydrolysing)
MCGINLLVDFQKQLSSDEAIRKMTGSLHHRGPDANASFCVGQGNKQLFIANNRLKIIDLSDAGNQPMQCNEGGKAGNRYTLSYNGELYNHFELKNELLRKGYTFHSNTDTEVLLYLLIEWGEAALSRLQGMFAFIFYDKETDRLLLARDRHGMKPLYYHSSDAYFLASSELRAIFASGLVAKKLNESQVYHYLQFRYAQKPQTFYQEVYELLPGHSLVWQTGSKAPELKAYPAPPKPVFEPSVPANLLKQLEERLTDALFSHLHTDRGAGLFLSGGVDSTLMLALLRKHSTYQLPVCYTISHKGKNSKPTEDAYWAAKAASQYDAPHVPIEIDSALLEQFPAFIAAQDQPIGDSAAWLTSVLSQKAASQVKVVLSGAGADELFGGYNRHKAFYLYLQHFRRLQWLLPVLKSAGKVLPSGSGLPGGQQSRLIKKLLQDIDPSPAQTFQNFISFSAKAAKAGEEISNEHSPFEEGWMLAALQHDRRHYLTSDILALNDKAAMQNSLEMRMPYLSEEVSALAEALPASFIMQKGRKWILNQLLTANKGAAYVKRQKQGFGLPFGLWIKEGKTDFLWRWLEQTNHPLHRFIEAEHTRKLLQAHKSGKQDHSMELFSLSVLAHWLEKEFA